MPQPTYKAMIEWLEDDTNNPYRILIIEMHHTNGVVRLASRPWMSEGFIPFDDWITNFPVFEEVESDFTTVGNIKAINPYTSIPAFPVVTTYSDNAPHLVSPLQGVTLTDTQTFDVKRWNAFNTATVFADELFRFTVGNRPNTDFIFDSGWIDRTGVDDWSHTVTNMPQDGRLLYITVWFNQLKDGDTFTVDRTYEFLANNPEQWIDKDFRGQPCVWRFGDTRWFYDDMWIGVRTLIQDCEILDGRLHQFNIASSGSILEKTLVTADETRTESAELLMDWAVALVPDVPVIDWTAVIEYKKLIRLSHTIKPEDTLRDLVDLVALSLGCGYRMRPEDNGLEFYDLSYNPNFTPNLQRFVHIYEDDIVQGRIKPVQTVHPSNKITLNFTVDRSHESVNAVDNGAYYEELTFNTIIDQDVHAVNILNVYKTVHESRKTVWQLGLLRVSEVIRVGNPVRLHLKELTGTGIITRVNRTPLSRFVIIEVRV